MLENISEILVALLEEREKMKEKTITTPLKETQIKHPSNPYSLVESFGMHVCRQA